MGRIASVSLPPAIQGPFEHGDSIGPGGNNNASGNWALAVAALHRSHMKVYLVCLAAGGVM